ncbi:MAG: LEA type 2 family protein [Methanospirillum sp.]|uniref:LEA type 2 family protein n=1 Tax=Methanospirillum sp. TaxID=45200 RepID=UPI0023763E96|nr:LEA type 2 family protein [Methanospirillum sp.]MDD1727989.1 LEA type 2 family protein [Methanospirillum sp.]
MERRSWIIILVSILVILLICGAAGVSLFAKAPTATITGVSLNSVNLSAIDLTINVSVDSPYPVAVPVKSLNYSITYQGKDGAMPLGNGEQKGFTIKPGSHELEIPIILSNPSLIQSALQVLKTGEIKITVTGTLTPDFFGIAPPVPFTKETTIPIRDQIMIGIGSLAGSVLQSVLP